VIIAFLVTSTLGVRRTPNQTDGDVTFSRLCDRVKKKVER